MNQPPTPPTEPTPQDWSLRTVRWLFWSAVTLHCLLWILGPVLLFPNLALDTLEMLVVGQNWVPASYKHPALPGWIVDVIFRLTGSVDFAPYIAAQLATVLAVWGIWALLSRCFSRRTAVLGAIATLGCFALGLFNFKYDNLTFMRTFWVLSALSLLLAVEENRWYHWTLCGVFLAGGLSCHFLTGLLILAILVYMTADTTARKYWKTPGPYLSTAVCALLMLPLFFWILRNGFSQYTYAMGSFEKGLGGPLTHVLYPLRFLGTQLLLCCTTLLPLLPLTGFHWHWNWKGLWSTPAQRLVTTLMFLPLVIELVLCAISGSKLPNRLGSGFVLFFPTWVFCVVLCRQDETAYRRGVWLGFVNILLIFSFYLVGTLFVASKTSHLFYPGKELARCVESAWKSQTDAPLLFVRGDNWPASCVNAYHPNRPRVWSTLWTDEETFRKTGGMLLWIEPADESAAVATHQPATHQPETEAAAEPATPSTQAITTEPANQPDVPPTGEPTDQPTEPLQPTAEPLQRPCSLTDWYGQDCFYTDGQEVPTEWLARFPNAKILPPVTLTSSRAKTHPVKVGMAFVPPAE